MAISHTSNGYGFTGTDVATIPCNGIPDVNTGKGYAGKGSMCIDYKNGELYINKGDKTTPSWKKVTTA